MFPILFNIGNFQIRTYSVILLITFVVGIFLLRRTLKRRTLINPDIVIDIAFWVILGVVIGSRLAYVFMHWPEYSASPERIFKIWEGGAVYYGGFILAFVFGGAYLLIKKIPIIPMLDAIAPIVALGEGIGRLGCFFNGCCYGKATDSFLGIIYPYDSLCYHYPANYSYGTHVWPTPLFQVLGGLLLFLFLTILPRFTKLRNGQLFGAFLVGFGGLRLLVNFFRFYEDSINLWTNNWIAIALITFGIALLLIFGLTQKQLPSLEEIANERKRLEAATHKNKKKRA